MTVDIEEETITTYYLTCDDCDWECETESRYRAEEYADAHEAEHVEGDHRPGGLTEREQFQAALDRAYDSVKRSFA